MIITILLLLHGLLAMLLVGAITHQLIAAWRNAPTQGAQFFRRLANVNTTSYTNAVILLYIAVVIGGSIIYPTYVIDVKASLTDAQMLSAIGAFEIKEHMAVFGLALLPTYRYFWSVDNSPAHALARKLNTTVVALIVWWSLGVGHILNNIKGL